MGNDGKKKRINVRAKGRRAELACKKIHEKAGWDVEIVHGAQMYNISVDMFNLWDLCCTRGKYWKFIQVKCNRKPSFKKYQAFADKHGNTYMSFEIWVKKDYNGWDVYSLLEE